jgi:molecular chaperone HtpG
VKIPSKFKKRLREDPKLVSLVKDIVTTFESILKDNNLFFFEEYTDHGIEHIERVLKTAEFLIPDKLFKHILPKEVAILTIATILHDIGMHTNYSTFKALIAGKYNGVRIDVLDKKEWSNLWNEYLSEQKYWNDKKMISMFGENNKNYIFKEESLSQHASLNGNDKKIIGEFIRKYHDRLAHEIVLKGYIKNDGSIQCFGSNKFIERYKQFSGIVARSHRMDIRETFKFLQSIGLGKAWKKPEGIHIIYLMVLLRIADALQIDETRANPILLEIKGINSPISLKEHKKHLTVLNLNYGKDDEMGDPELIYVECIRPENAQLYVEIQELITYIQHEFDLSWAILGETYGLSEKTKIKFRRIESNLEDENFVKEIKYIPRRIAFRIDSNISKLLVKPLYGDNPIYGIRELVQNATDACKERMNIEQRKEHKNYNPLVTVSIDKINEEQYKFTIVDNGRGMNLSEILNYFLSIGSSFRYDINWKKEVSSVNRNGRFGIGILAAFLLGDEINVKTKSYKEDADGYIFKIRLNSENIDIEKFDNLDIGTTIEILMPHDKCAFLSKERVLESRSVFMVEDMFWTDWYINTVPHVQYFQNNKEIIGSIFFDIHMVRNIFPANYGKVQWKYLNKYGTFVSCNDIIITTQSSKDAFNYRDEENDSHNDNDSYLYSRSQIIHRRPSLKIEDPNGILPLRLDRNDLETGILSFEKDLFEDVSKDFIAQLLNLQIDSKHIEKYFNCITPHNVSFLFLKNGFILDSDYFINDKIKKQKLLRVITDMGSIEHSLIFEVSDNIVTYPTSIPTVDASCIIPKDDGSCILISKERSVNYLQNDNYLDLYLTSYMDRIFDDIKNNTIYRTDSTNVTHKLEWETEQYMLYSINNYKKNSKIFDKELGIFIMDNLEKNALAIQELPISCTHRSKGGKILNKLFEKYFGDNYIIPYDMEERRRIYKYAFDDLKDYMKDYENK